MLTCILSHQQCQLAFAVYLFTSRFCINFNTEWILEEPKMLFSFIHSPNWPIFKNKFYDFYRINSIISLAVMSPQQKCTNMHLFELHWPISFFWNGNKNVDGIGRSFHYSVSTWAIALCWAWLTFCAAVALLYETHNIKSGSSCLVLWWNIFYIHSHGLNLQVYLYSLALQ